MVVISSILHKVTQLKMAMHIGFVNFCTAVLVIMSLILKNYGENIFASFENIVRTFNFPCLQTIINIATRIISNKQLDSNSLCEGCFLVHIFPYLYWIRESTDQENSVFWKIWRSGRFIVPATLSVNQITNTSNLFSTLVGEKEEFNACS